MKIRHYSNINGEQFLEEIIDLVMMCGGSILFNDNLTWEIKDGDEVIHGLELDSPENPHLFLLKSKKRSSAKIKRALYILTFNKYNSTKNLLKHLKDEIRKRQKV